MDMSNIRKTAKGVFGKIQEELKVLNNIYFFKGEKGAGYMYCVSEYPELYEITNRRTLIGKEVWGLILDPLNFIKAIWLKPEIIDSLKKNVDSLKEFRNISKAEYRKMSLIRAEQTLRVSDPAFLEKHPKTN